MTIVLVLEGSHEDVFKILRETEKINESVASSISETADNI
jgi:hypothetical protein